MQTQSASASPPEPPPAVPPGTVAAIPVAEAATLSYQSVRRKVDDRPHSMLGAASLALSGALLLQEGVTVPVVTFLTGPIDNRADVWVPLLYLVQWCMSVICALVGFFDPGRKRLLPALGLDVALGLAFLLAVVG